MIDNDYDDNKVQDNDENDWLINDDDCEEDEIMVMMKFGMTICNYYMDEFY